MRVYLAILLLGILQDSECQGSEEDAKKWLMEYNVAFGEMLNEQVNADWTYNTDITDKNEQKQVAATVKLSEFNKEAANNASTFDWKNFNDADIKRQMKKVSDIGPDALKDAKKVQQLNEAISGMTSIYSKATINLNNETLQLDPGISELLASSRNYELLQEAWKLWRDASGAKMKTMYQTMVELSNEGSKENGYPDTGAFWRTPYEDADFQDSVEELLVQLKPMYMELHTYIRKKLRDLYGADKFPASGHIPAHILGNMWAQQWNNIYDIVIPYKNKPSVDVTPELIKQNYTVERMFKTSESFFTSIKLEEMVPSFWTDSLFTRPADKQVVCHASAWDFYNAQNFRIKMCTKINMEDLITIHHEMGHVEYFQLYKDQPEVYRDGANPGFHEAIGDTIALSVATPKHLREIGLLAPGADDSEAEINFLMSMALEKIAFLPFGYLIDQWRWSVFSGETQPDQYNQHWWDLRCKYQGISSPVKRTKDDFDPGAKFHIPSNVPYIRYFVSFVIQFQFHQALCKAAGHTGPLHRCDIYRSEAAGQALRTALSLGSSKPWPEVMTILTGQAKMDTGPLQEYFTPLTEWLKLQNKDEKKGWDESCPETDEAAEEFLRDYNTKVQDVNYRTSVISWKYSTNVTDTNEANRIQAELKAAEFTKEAAKNASNFDWKQLDNWSSRRKFKFITNIGTDAMTNKTKIERLSTVVSKMEEIFSK
ncbi:angiotensin-converting enzyme [Patella vulgata]|uniref:angiotensin-converting enzyme n=1 Tax=Patella vulgata TaxID=6465 RepID=UPI0024A9D879|nr:angiotensin-converting enzyme [Patella vulgata]